MQTLTLEVEDSCVPNLLNYLNQFKNEVKIQHDKNLELDPYFYERQKELQQDIDDIESGKVKMIGSDDLWRDIDTFTQWLQK